MNRSTRDNTQVIDRQVYQLTVVASYAPLVLMLLAALMFI